MDCVQLTGLALAFLVAVPFAVYLCVRLGAAAYFRSKRDHELHLRRNN